MAHHSPMHKTASEEDEIPSAKITSEERAGLTSFEVEKLIQQWGYNELPEIKISLYYLFFLQFTGTMPYMLELAAIISIAVQDFEDFAIILAMLLANGCLGFHEQLKAAESLAELTNKMEQKIACIRDGKAEHLLTRCLVPGDIVLLVGGCQIPADIEWIEGDILSVDTAALTGEPLPRKYPSKDHGSLILCACTVRAGEAYGIVRKTGIHTEIGSTNVDIMKDKAKTRVSLFEERVLFAVKVIISISLIDILVIFLIQGFARDEFSDIDELLLTCLSIIIAAIPVALPLVMQVTMALGAGKMAREFDSVVTALPALQDISSMTVLCSDKTGTLTTARISIHAESVWACGSYSKQDVALYGVLASNPDKKEDPIDRSVTGHFNRVFGSAGDIMLKEYTKTRSVGFNPIYKRVLYEYTHPKIGKIVIAKGLPNKVLDTTDGGVDDAADQWVVNDAAKLKEIVKKVDYDFSVAGYKTLGVAVKINDRPWEYCGILPMLDPPRHDTAQTIRNLVSAGIEVKMITGDHLNIAKETARLIGMGVNIHPGEATREANDGRDQLIKNANGFAQVLPRDKREVVLVLRNTYNQICGMTGDGVNDAPALSAAQCGIAVDDATDAAKNAAAIILTSPGLSAIYSAVVESRRIFRKLKSYVTYRFAATIQIVCVLSLLIFISDCAVNSLYIILLALFNDLTMLPIAYDNQNASSKPEHPDVYKMLSVSAALGVLETIFSLVFAYAIIPRPAFHAEYSVSKCGKQTQAIIWVQMFIAAELLIFTTRASKYIITSLLPSAALTISVLGGCLLVSLMAGCSHYFGYIPYQDILITWAYNICGLLVCDILKVMMYEFFEENTEVLPDYVVDRTAVDESGKHSEVVSSPIASPVSNKEDEEMSKQDHVSARLATWASNSRKGDVTGGNELSRTTSFSASYKRRPPKGADTSFSLGRSLADSYNYDGSSVLSFSVPTTSDMHPSILAGSFRPRVPANKHKLY